METRNGGSGAGSLGSATAGLEGSRPVEAPGADALWTASREVDAAHRLEAAGDLEGAAARLGHAVARLGPLPLLCVPLARLLQALTRWDALAALARAAGAACTDVREAAAWQLRLAAACEAMGDVSGAVAAHHAALAAWPRELRALHGLQRLHRRQGDDAALARALEGELSLCAGDEEIAIRRELAALLAGPLGRSSEALVHLRRVLDLAPGATDVLARALDLAEALGAAADEVALLDVERAQVRDATGLARILARQASLLAGPLANNAHAIARWREALALDPAIPGAREGLRVALEREGDWAAVLDLLLEESDRVGPEARRALLEHAANVAAERRAPDAALPWLERLRAEAPRDASVLARMADIHRRAGRTRALAACIEAELALDPSPERAHDLERERAALARGIGCEPPSAAPIPVPAPASPRHPVRRRMRTLPLPALAPLPDDPAAEVRALETELAALHPQAPVFAERRCALRLRLSQLCVTWLGDPERALPHLRALASEGSAGDPGLTGAEAAWAEDQLLACLRAEASHAELAERLAARLERHPDDPSGWLALAEIQEGHLHAPASAAQSYHQALAHGAPAHEALPGLRRSAEALGDWTESARALELQIASETSPVARARLLRELGEISWRRLGATTRASRAFAAALESDPRDLVSLRALQQLLASMEDWRGALDLIESEIELLPCEAGAARRELWLRAAAIAADRVGDPERAIRALDAAHAIAPLDGALRARLADLLHESGALARYVEVAERCIEERSEGPDPAGELRLAAALLELGRLEDARTRVKHALGAAPQHRGAWELLAGIRLAQGAPEDAAESLVRAAEGAGPAAAVTLLLRAAALVEANDPEFAHALRQGACRRDPGSVAGQAARARSALSLGRGPEAEEAALRAVELALAPPPDLDACALQETILGVVRATRDAGHLALATRLLDALRAVVPGAPAVLRAQAEVLFAADDRRGAREAVVALFACDETSRKAAELIVIDAAGLEQEGALDEAVERYAEAAHLDPGHEPAWSGLARVHERAGRLLDAMHALDAGARHVPGPLAARLRAAELALAGDDGEAALRRLRDLQREAPECHRAAELLAERLLEEARPDEALAGVTAALPHAGTPASVAALQRLRARALDALGRREEARAAWACVLASDPNAVDAARAVAALHRAAGRWREAAGSLEAFLASGPEASRGSLAELWLALSWLRAGPLGQRDAAREACAEALRLDPGSRRARETLADLLVEDPARRAEAVARHRELLEVTPDRVASLQALTRLAEAAGATDLVEDGRTLLRALAARGTGAAEPLRLRLRVVRTACLENPVWEQARRVARVAAGPISRALEASDRLEPPAVTGARERFRLAAVVAEADLAGPALVPLRDRDAGAVIVTAAALASEREVISADGRLVNALSLTLGRATRRRIREALAGTSPEEIADIDFAAWRAGLRSLAHAMALDATGGDLGAALDALADEDAVTGTPGAARELWRRAVAAFGRGVAEQGGTP